MIIKTFFVTFDHKPRKDALEEDIPGNFYHRAKARNFLLCAGLRSEGIFKVQLRAISRNSA